MTVLATVLTKHLLIHLIELVTVIVLTKHLLIHLIKLVTVTVTVIVIVIEHKARNCNHTRHRRN